MAKKKKDLDLASSSHLNQIQGSTNAVFNVIFVILALTCIIPVIFIFMISISSEQSIKMNGYQFIPSAYSLDSYKFLLREGGMILTALGVSVAVTVIGTILGVILTMLMGYVLSRSTYKLNGFFTMVVFIPMIFNGGMISSYVVNTQFLNLKNSIWALILPLCVSSFNVVICKTFFKTNIPESIIESAQIDGASRFQRIFYVDVPAILPTASIMLILAVGNIMNVGFEKVLLMQNSLNMNDSEIVSTYVYKVGLASGVTDFSLSTAIGMFNSVINFILLLLANEGSKRLNGNGIF